MVHTLKASFGYAQPRQATATGDRGIHVACIGVKRQVDGVLVCRGRAYPNGIFEAIKL